MIYDKMVYSSVLLYFKFDQTNKKKTESIQHSPFSTL